MDYLLLNEKGHTFCRRTEGLKGYRLLAHPSQVPLIDSCIKLGDTRFCCSNLPRGPNLMDEESVVDRMVSLKDTDYALPNERPDVWDGLKFAATYNEMETNALFEKSSNVQKLLNALRHHPAVLGGLGFAFRNTFTPHIARLLAEIYDIRRFFKPGRLKSISRLKNYFRLVTPRRVRSLRGRTTQTLGDARLLIVLDAWRDHPITGEAIGEGRAPDTYFPGVYYTLCNAIEAAGVSEIGTTTYAVWYATVEFLRFVFWTWGHQTGRLTFDPDKLFVAPCASDENVAQSFRTYISSPDLDGMELLI